MCQGSFNGVSRKFPRRRRIQNVIGLKSVILMSVVILDFLIRVDAVNFLAVIICNSLLKCLLRTLTVISFKNRKYFVVLV